MRTMYKHQLDIYTQRKVSASEETPKSRLQLKRYAKRRLPDVYVIETRSVSGQPTTYTVRKAR